MLVLTPIDVADFFATCHPEHIPTLATWQPVADAPGGGWRFAGPTCHAFAWVYRAPLLRLLLTAIEQARKMQVRCKSDVSPM